MNKNTAPSNAIGFWNDDCMQVNNKYEPPLLTCIGKLENLTTGGSGRSRENKNKNKDKNKSRP